MSINHRDVPASIRGMMVAGILGLLAWLAVALLFVL